jgi:outer membrane lipoprotein-sorting protein
MKRFILLFVFAFAFFHSFSQSADLLIQKVAAKLATVKHYEAHGTLKTDVPFLKLPLSEVEISFSFPDQITIKKEGGVTVLPKGGLKISMNSLLVDGNYTSFSAGRINWKGKDLLMVKLVPNAANSDVVISTLYVDEKEFLIRKAITTTKDNGTYEIEMDYGKYAKWALPDKALMSFSLKDYKLPKAITFEYDAGIEEKKEAKKTTDNKGKVEIIYSSYIINKG